MRKDGSCSRLEVSFNKWEWTRTSFLLFCPLSWRKSSNDKVVIYLVRRWASLGHVLLKSVITIKLFSRGVKIISTSCLCRVHLFVMHIVITENKRTWKKRPHLHVCHWNMSFDKKVACSLRNTVSCESKTKSTLPGTIPVVNVKPIFQVLGNKNNRHAIPYCK